MIARLVPAAVFKTVVPVRNRELGSIPRRSRHLEIPVITGISLFDSVYLLYFDSINNFKTKKGNFNQTAIIAGIIGAKETSRLIPLCHNIPINHVNIDIKKDNKKNSILIEALVKTIANTGVEMEALTAVSISCLTIYDMCKYLNKKIEIQNIKLIKKTGGKSNI